MQTRRQFIRNGTTMAGGILFAGNFRLGPRPLGVQLFTFFNEIDNDVEGTIKSIASIGYTEIESAFSKKGGFYGMKVKEFSALLNRYGLSWKAHHVLGAPFKLPPGAKMPSGPDGKPMVIPPMLNLKENMQQLVDDVSEAGIPYLVCANIPIGSKSEVLDAIEILNNTGKATKKAGMTLAYHNHDAEFKLLEDGMIPYQYFLDHLSTDIKMELDLAWAVKAGVDPVELIRKHPGRFPLWHVKDLDRDGNVLPVGAGSIDFRNIFSHAEIAGLEHCFIEHDMPKDPLVSIQASYRYIRERLSF